LSALKPHAEIRIITLLMVHDDASFLSATLAANAAAGPAALLVSRVPWHGPVGDWEGAVAIAEAAGSEVVLGEWRSEEEHRRAAQEWALAKGFTHALIPDSDEIIEPELLQTLLAIAQAGVAERVYVQMDTYWKGFGSGGEIGPAADGAPTGYVIRPREGCTPLMLVDLRAASPVKLRQYAGGRGLLLNAEEYGRLHHLSYAGPDERIRRKLETWGHRDEVVPNWYEDVWQAWDTDRTMRRLHPTHPQAYAFAERIRLPEILHPLAAQLNLQTPILQNELPITPLTGDSPLPPRGPGAPRAAVRGGGTPQPPVLQNELASTRNQELETRNSALAVVIPLHGGTEDILGCLQSLRASADLLAEVVVVDNASPDGAAEAVEAFAVEAGESLPVRVLRLAENRGFAHACNVGFSATTAPRVLFLNSDTLVPRVGLERLVKALASSATVGMVGPYTNRSGHYQQVDPTYTSLDTLDLFAEDWSQRSAEDRETDMLTGFCLLARRSALLEVALPPTPHAPVEPIPPSPSPGMGRGQGWGVFDERFGLGTFEDNDLCYRLRRAGWRLLLAARAWVHHHGSRTLARLPAAGGPEPAALLRGNEARYRRKWRQDLETGYASHLSGLPPPEDGPRGPEGEARVRFEASRRPDALARSWQARVKQARISLCMIVRNEKRVLAECLESARPFAWEVIVVDTGSTDRTVEIARGCGARVVEMAWPDSFAEARNESLRHATGRWVLWLDADDVLPWATGEALVHAAQQAPENVCGFIVPVQFVDEGSTLERPVGTRVDHVKLFRRHPDLRWEGRIHEQILGSLRQVFGPDRCEVARLVHQGGDPALVLHANYDTSVEGQAGKRRRDAALLELDLQDRPEHPFLLFNLGMTHHYLGEDAEAVGWLERSLAASAPHESHYYKACSLLGVSLHRLGRDEESLRALELGLTAAPEDPELLFHRAQSAWRAGKLSESRDFYVKAATSSPNGRFHSVDTAIYGPGGYKTFHNLGVVCQALGDYPQARYWWQQALGAAPSHLASAAALREAAWRTGDRVTGRVMDALLAERAP